MQVHSTCLIFPAGYLLGVGWFEDGLGAFWTMVLLLLILGLSLLAHEFAHIFAARGCGIETSRMLFLPVGAVAFLEDLPRFGRELWIAIAGPLASLALVGLCQLGILAMHEFPSPFLHHHSLFYSVNKFLSLGSELNLILALFNLLPCFPMDGGRILRSLLALSLWKFTSRSRDRALLTATRITVRFVALPLAFGAIVFTIAHTHVWMHLLLFPLALALGELEYWMLRDTR